MAIVKKEKNPKTNEWWYTIISKSMKEVGNGEYIKTSIPVMVKANRIKTSKDGNIKYFSVSAKNFSSVVLCEKDKKEKKENK
jgi:hypothetical protein